jgi:serine phosphatase RsbU (regulator of sigma subunit)
MMIRLLVLGFFLFSIASGSNFLLGQSRERIHEFEAKIAKTKDKEKQMGWYKELFLEYRLFNADTAAIVLNRMEKVAMTSDQKALIICLQGMLERTRGNLEESQEFFNRSLKKTSSKNYEQRIYILMNKGFSYEYLSMNDKAIEEYHKAWDLAELAQDDSLRGEAANNLGNAFYYLGELDSAYYYLETSYKYAKARNSEDQMADAKLNMGNILMDRGDNSGALQRYVEAGALYRKAGIKWKEAFAFQNMAQIRINEENYQMAEKLLKDAMALSVESNDSGLIVKTLMMQGYVQESTANRKEALRNFQYCLKYFKRRGLPAEQARALNSIGVLYSGEGNMEQAIIYFKECFDIKTELSDISGMINTMLNLGESNLRLNRTVEALTVYNQAKELAEKHGYYRYQVKVWGALADVFAAQGNFKNAYEFQVLYVRGNDSLFKEESQRANSEMLAKFQTEKKELENAKLREASGKIAAERQLEDARRAEEEAKQSARYRLVVGAAFFMMIILTLVIIVLRKTRKSKRIISKQKQEVEIQKKEVELQHKIVEEKNKEITDSITYARRIQQAILPSEVSLKENLPEHFVLYLPKDIVAGDFYWMERIDNRVLFAAADCTGHGVPGAMVSVVCNNALNRAVREFGLTDPGKILDKTREIVISEFAKSTDDVKDGMDISLVALAPVGTDGHLSLQWAGANNPLWIIRNGEVLETKPDKQPIGKFADAKPFTTHSIELQKGDTIFIFTDGYQDQFGGDKGKKYKAANLKNLLLSNINEPMKRQCFLLQNELNTWRRDNEQIDDVCVIGVRI